MKYWNTLNLIGKIHSAANQFIINELEKHGIKGMVPSHGDILNVLYNNKSMTMKEIAIKIKRTQPTVTVLIDKLVEYGYVLKIKDTDDTRITNITLTKKGEDFQVIFHDISHNLNIKMHKGLNKDETGLLQNILERVSNNW